MATRIEVWVAGTFGCQRATAVVTLPMPPPARKLVQSWSNGSRPVLECQWTNHLELSAEGSIKNQDQTKVKSPTFDPEKPSGREHGAPWRRVALVREVQGS